ncbi:hypothetical protein [uncultured Helicobacter sp.]|uniref:hypothetical protein n=1 Tax=uncultured Helicobacter sp. TaxID=175537 RepID=UPI0026312572|nr:hypothetical protein [uncultured Helicobacter sp.]
MKAFALLEFLVFIAVLGVVIMGILGNFKQNYKKDLQNPQDFFYEYVTLCNKISQDCILDSKIITPTPFFEINATRAH